MVLYHVGTRPVYLPHLIIGLVVAALMTAINYRGIQVSAGFQTWTTLSVIALALAVASAGFGHGSTENLEPLFPRNPFVAILLVVQIVPFFMEGFESVGKTAEEAEAGFGGQRFFLAIGLALCVGILFYVMVIAAVSFAAPRQTFLNESFATAVALEKSVGSHWVVSLIMATAFLSVLKCFNANMVAASRMFFGLGRRGLVHPGVGYVHPRNLTPSVAILCVGLATVIAVFGGDAILVPVSEVGSVTAAVGWMAACASLGRMKPTSKELTAVVVGLTLTAVLVLMKVIPAVPGHFNVYEWIAVAVWSVLGLALHRGSRQPALATAAAQADS
jgi:amino acid transporter